MASLAVLVHAMQRGSVEMLLILDVNAAFSAPADLDFAGQLSAVKLTVHWGLYDDETAALCHWHLPAAHDFESWSDAQAFDGTATIMQPLIAPLYGGKTIHEVLSLVIDPVPRGSHDIVRDYWRGQWDKHRGGGSLRIVRPAAAAWLVRMVPAARQINSRNSGKTSLQTDGVVAGAFAAFTAKEPTLATDLTEKLCRDTPARERPLPSGRYVRNHLPARPDGVRWPLVEQWLAARMSQAADEAHMGQRGVGRNEHGRGP